jgi:cation transport regulator ChaB
MPYSLKNPPKKIIKNLPNKAKNIWIKAFNNAFKTYDGNEEKSSRIAWSAIEKAGYKKINGIWKRWE